MYWATIKYSDIQDDKNIPYKFEAHKFTKRLVERWEYCSSCGLIALRNDPTFWAIKTGCNYEKHPNFKKAG